MGGVTVNVFAESLPLARFDFGYLQHCTFWPSAKGIKEKESPIPSPCSAGKLTGTAPIPRLRLLPLHPLGLQFVGHEEHIRRTFAQNTESVSSVLYANAHDHEGQISAISTARSVNLRIRPEDFRLRLQPACDHRKADRFSSQRVTSYPVWLATKTPTRRWIVDFPTLGRPTIASENDIYAP